MPNRLAGNGVRHPAARCRGRYGSLSLRSTSSRQLYSALCLPRRAASRRVARVFVATPRDDARRLAGFFSLSAGSVSCEDLPPEIARKLPRYPVPIALLGRLAIDQAFRNPSLDFDLSSALLFGRHKTRLSHRGASVADADADADPMIVAITPAQGTTLTTGNNRQ